MRVAPGPIANLDWLYEIRNGRAFGRQSGAGAVAGEYGQVQLLNPAGSTITVFVYEVQVYRTTAGAIQPTDYATALATLAGAGVNLNLGGAAGQAVVRTGSNAALVGNPFGAKFVPAAQMWQLSQPWIAVLDAGEAVTCQSNTANEAVNTYYRWVEK